MNTLTYRGVLETVKCYEHSDITEIQLEKGNNRYALDLTQGRYLYMDETVPEIIQQPYSFIMEGGLDLVLNRIWFEEYFDIYNRIILPANLEYLKSVPPAYHKDLLFTCNYWVKHRNGGYKNIEQQTCFTKTSKDGLPLVASGMLYDITHREDNKIVHTIRNKHTNKILKRWVHILNSDKLSEREVEVFRLVCDGKGNKEIGELLTISHFTVGNHRKNIEAKIGLKPMAWVKYGLQKGIIE